MAAPEQVLQINTIKAKTEYIFNNANYVKLEMKLYTISLVARVKSFKQTINTSTIGWKN